MASPVNLNTARQILSDLSQNLGSTLTSIWQSVKTRGSESATKISTVTSSQVAALKSKYEGLPEHQKRLILAGIATASIILATAITLGSLGAFQALTGFLLAITAIAIASGVIIVNNADDDELWFEGLDSSPTLLERLSGAISSLLHLNSDKELDITSRYLRLRKLLSEHSEIIEPIPRGSYETFIARIIANDSDLDLFRPNEEEVRKTYLRLLVASFPE